MKRDISALAEKEYDVVVVGAGIFGICVAWDAIRRGLSVALIDQGDFGHATSANHFKMVHGGIRYLQHADLRRVRESSQERNVLLRIAPHLVQPLPFVMPTYNHGLQGREVMMAGLLLYDFITFDRNWNISDPERRIPRGRVISRKECLEMFPYLEQRGLTGAAIFHEAQMYNPPRLSLAFLRAAVEAGAVAANYVQMTEFMQDRERVTGVRAKDRLSGDLLEIRAKVVINAAGPWADDLLRRSLGAGLHAKPSFSRDVCFVVDRPLVSEKYALALQAETRDADALISRGHRHLFLVPWRDYTLVGVWHVLHQGGPEDYSLTDLELEAFLDEINQAYPALDLTVQDISVVNTGLILFGDDDQKGREHSFGKRSLIIDHLQEHGLEGLITVIGVRYTTARGIAEKVVNLVFDKFGKEAPRSKTAVTPIYGGEIECFEEYLRDAIEQRPGGLSANAVSALVHNHGSAYREVLNYLEEEPAWAQPLGSSDVIEAAVVHAVEQEMAQKLGDVVFRRTDLGTGKHPGEEALRRCADLVASRLGWDESRVERELNQVKSAFSYFQRSNSSDRPVSVTV